jgi:hypothetical protein
MAGWRRRGLMKESNQLGPLHRKVLILKPRLDIMFKKGPVPKDRGPIERVRYHWKKFVDLLHEAHDNNGDIVHVLELPNWQIDPSIVQFLQPDIVYIPHKQKHQFAVDSKHNPRYYMQMVFPWLFQVDDQGWGPDASVYPIEPNAATNGVLYDKLRSRQKAGHSKFDQPPIVLWPDQPDSYIFFPCQLPHDETIKYHSDVSVADALRYTIAYCEARSQQLIIKAHPVNPGSMDELRKIGSNHIWADDININTCIMGADAIVMVNSGVGMESILHGKRVGVFGRADYDSVVHKITPDNYLVDFDRMMDCPPTLIKAKYKGFIDAYVEAMVDSTNIDTYNKLLT